MEKKKEQSLPFFMIAGSLGTVIHGYAMLVFFLLFGGMTNGFSKHQSDFRKMTEDGKQMRKNQSERW